MVVSSWFSCDVSRNAAGGLDRTLVALRRRDLSLSECAYGGTQAAANQSNGGLSGLFPVAVPKSLASDFHTALWLLWKQGDSRRSEHVEPARGSAFAHWWSPERRLRKEPAPPLWRSPTPTLSRTRLSSAPKGHHNPAQGRAQRRQPRSAALGLNCWNGPSPGRAKQGAISAPVPPFQGSAGWNSATWGGAPVGRSAPGYFVMPFQGGGLDAIIESWPRCVPDPGSMELCRTQRGPPVSE